MSYVNSVTVHPSSVTVTKGKWYYGAYASIASDCPECAEVRWYSNNSSIASVNASTGYIYGVNTGTTRIYAEATDGSGKKDYITVTVTAPVSVTGVSVCPTSLTMNVGDIDYVNATVYPLNATNQTVTWCSSDDSVVEVNMYTGFVRAKKAGVATITACTVDGNYSASCVVNVNYCGGVDYRDVTKHNMVSCDDGYYVCTRCGYRVKSPALQDQEVLNKSDYLTIASLYHEAVVLAEQAPIRTEALLAAVDYIRGLPENRTKYEYQGANGIYHPENSAKLKNVEIWIHVDKGSCIREWRLMNILFPLVGAVIPPPYSYMFSVVSTALMQEHPAATSLSGTEIFLEYASELAGQKEILPKWVASALGVLFGLGEALNGDSPCSENCYNITLTLLCRDEGEECYQIDYHFSGGIETLGRADPCWVSAPGTAPYNSELLYEDRVNDRRYTFEE